jgi:hypothetical protein
MTLAFVCVLERQSPIFVTLNLCIAVKNKVGWSAVVCCACRVTQLLSAVF